jgi:hypothetical protein
MALRPEGVTTCSVQMKDILSSKGVLYMVTVMDNDPQEILDTLARDGIQGA